MNECRVATRQRPWSSTRDLRVGGLLARCTGHRTWPLSLSVIVDGVASSPCSALGTVEGPGQGAKPRGRDWTPVGGTHTRPLALRPHHQRKTGAAITEIKIIGIKPEKAGEGAPDPHCSSRCKKASFFSAVYSLIVPWRWALKCRGT